MDLQSLPVTWRAAIPESYLDEMGHMNVMWYTHLFSEATGKLWELLGMDRAYFERDHAGTFALEFHVRFLAEIRASEHVTVRSRLLGRSLKRFHFMHFLTNETRGVLSATEEAVGSHVDMRARRASPLPAHFIQAFDELLAAQSRLDWDPPVCGVMRA
jgi:acyl-CoA thioester hydrolase